MFTGLFFTFVGNKWMWENSAQMQIVSLNWWQYAGRVWSHANSAQFPNSQFAPKLKLNTAHWNNSLHIGGTWYCPSDPYTNYTIVWFLRAPRWYIGPTAMPRAAVTPIAPERSEGAIGCDSRPRHCRRDDIPAWRPNKITLLSLLPLDLMMYHRFISFMCAVQSREGRWFNPRYCL